MAYEDIRNKFLPILQRTQGYGSLGQQDPRFANAQKILEQGAIQRAGLDKQLSRDIGTMRTGAALQIASPAIGLVNPVAGGVTFGAGNQMMGLKSGSGIAQGAAIGGASAGMLNKAISGLQASPLAQNIRNSLINRMPNKVMTPANNIERNMTANAFGGKTQNGAIQDLFHKKFGVSPDINSINMRDPNAYTRAGVRGHYDNSPTPVDFTKSYNQATPIVKSPSGQVTNNFSNTAPGNTFIRDYPQQNAGSLEDLIQASIGRMPAQSPTPVQPNMPVHGQSIPLNNVTNDFSNTSPMNTVIQQPQGNLPSTYTSANDAIQGFMNDLNSGLMNQFGANSSPMGSAGSMGSLINAENVGMQGMVNRTIPEDIGKFGMNFINKW